MSNVRVCVTIKIQENPKHAAKVEIARGTLLVFMFGKRLSFGRGELSIRGSNIEDNSFYYLFYQTFWGHIEKSIVRIMLDVNSKNPAA